MEFEFVNLKQNSYMDTVNRLAEIDAELQADFMRHANKDSSVQSLLGFIKSKFPVDNMHGIAFDAWETLGIYFLSASKNSEALIFFRSFYEHLCETQFVLGKRICKGTPLIWMSECFFRLKFFVHANRYLMLAHCEDAIEKEGVLDRNLGVYWRAISRHNLSDALLEKYSARVFEMYKNRGDDSLLPESLLQDLDLDWLTSVPSEMEAQYYITNFYYVRWCASKLGEGKGKNLERLAEYVLSCIPGCRTTRNMKSKNTEYDVICSLDGAQVDFRSDLGRYFACECKDISAPFDVSMIRAVQFSSCEGVGEGVIWVQGVDEEFPRDVFCAVCTKNIEGETA